MSKTYVAAAAVRPFGDPLEIRVLFFDEEPTEETVKMNMAEADINEIYPDMTIEQALEEDGYTSFEEYVEEMFGPEDEYAIDIVEVPAE